MVKNRENNGMKRGTFLVTPVLRPEYSEQFAAMVLFHNDFSPGGEQPKLRTLAQMF